MASDQTTPPIDPPPEYLRQGRIDDSPVRKSVETGGLRRVGLVVVATAIIAASATGMWLAYEQGVRKGVQMAPPLIRADTSPIKVAPENPGGMEVPHQDKSVYDRLSGKPETVEAERLLPPPEVVVKKPEPVAEPEVMPETNAGTAREVPLVKAEEPVAVVKEAPVVPEVKPAPKPAPKPVAKVVAKVAKAAPAPPPAAAKKAPKNLKPKAPAAKPAGHLVQVGAYRTAAKATEGWNRLVKANKALLGSLKPFVVRADLGNRGVFHRLRAGPVDGAEAAAALCQRLKQRKVGCLVIKP